MAKYKKILLAVDFAGDNVHIVDRAKQVVADHGAELLLIHVNEPVMTAYPAGGMAAMSTQAVALEEELRKVGEDKMKALSSDLGVPESRCFLPYGRASSEIKRVAEEEGVDLIVIGTHGQHGLQLILGSTANAVLHGVTCDVLAVRAGGDES